MLLINVILRLITSHYFACKSHFFITSLIFALCNAIILPHYAFYSISFSRANFVTTLFWSKLWEDKSEKLVFSLLNCDLCTWFFYFFFRWNKGLKNSSCSLSTEFKFKVFYNVYICIFSLRMANVNDCHVYRVYYSGAFIMDFAGHS